MAVHAGEPTDDMRARAIDHALSVCDVEDVHAGTWDHDPRVIRRDAYGQEACGVMFYPDRRIGGSASFMPTVPRFIPLTNVWEPADQRDLRFTWDSDELIAEVIRTYGTPPGGFVQLWHSHLRDAGPSTEDYDAILTLRDALSATPLWGVTDDHLVYVVPTGRWVSYRARVAPSSGRILR